MDRNTKALIIALASAFLAFAVWSARQKAEAPAGIPDGNPEITNFEECAAAGYPVGESYPLQCFAEGETFIQETGAEPEDEAEDEEVMDPLTETEALELAKEKCPAEVVTWGPGSYNENSETWWFDVTLKEPKSGCNPACVVDDLTGEVEINWRCTGLIPANGIKEGCSGICPQFRLPAPGWCEGGRIVKGVDECGCEKMPICEK